MVLPVLRHEICLISVQFGGVASDKTQRMDFLILFRLFRVPLYVGHGLIA